MTKRASARKARVFSAPSHLRAAPEVKIKERVNEIVQPSAANEVSFSVQDHEAAYLVGALIEAQRSAEAAQQQWLAVGDRAQAEVFEQKATAIGNLTTRVAQAITRRKR